MENTNMLDIESKDYGCKWNFVERNPSSYEQGSEDSSFKPFLPRPLRCLVREYIQNSLDAHDKTLGDPVRVVFSQGELECRDYPQLIGALPDRLRACSEYCSSFNNGRDPYKEKIEYLKTHLDNKIGYLKVSDYNTTGMPYDYDRFKTSAFKACVKGSGSSLKGSEHAGGSHGIGKTVGFVNSGINAVYYCTRTKNGDTFGQGVIKLCDHDLINENGEKTRYENVAFFDGQKGIHPDSGDTIPEVFRKERTEPGTDAFVIGIEMNDENILTMKREVLRSFFKAFYDNLLIVEICGESIDQSNVAEKLLVYYPNEGELDIIKARDVEIRFNPRPYYAEVLLKQGLDDDHKVFDSNIDFPEEYLNLGHSLLYMWKSDTIKQAKARDSVVYMRDNNMVIDVMRGRNNLGYYAIFFCDGDGSEILRRMENATHDKWDLDELRDESKEVKKKAERTLQEVKSFILACEKKMFPAGDDEEHIIASLRNRRVSVLGDHRQDDDEESIWPSTNITERVRANKSNGQSTILETIKGKRKKKKAVGKKISTETNIGPSITPANPNPPTPQPPTPLPPTPIPPDPTPPNPNPPQPTPPKGFPEIPDPPTVSGEGSIEGNVNETEESGGRMREIKIDGKDRYLIPLHDGEFACKLILNVNREYENCRLELFVQGITGQMPLSLRRVSDGYKIGGMDSNEIVGFNLIAGSNTIKFTPIENVKNYTLIIKAYGN